MTSRLILMALGALLVAAPAAAPAHVTISPNSSKVGAWEKYVIRLPNEKAVATTALEIRFPKGLRVISFEDKPGWPVAPVRDSAGTITGARWTGELPPERFIELGVVAVNPKAGGDLVWTAVQSFADGSSVSWSGPKGSSSPAPHVALVAASD